MIYVLYHTQTRRPVSIGSREPRDVREPLAVYLLPEPYETLSRYEWDADSLTLVPRKPPTPPTRMTAGDFARRVGFDRERALQSLKHRADIDADTKGTVDTLLAWLQRVLVTGVDITDPVAIGGSGIIGDLLQQHAPALIPMGREAYVASLLAPLTPREALSAREGGGE